MKIIAILISITLLSGCSSFVKAMKEREIAQQAEAEARQARWQAMTPFQRQGVRRENCRQWYENSANKIYGYGRSQSEIANYLTQIKMNYGICMSRAAEQQ